MNKQTVKKSLYAAIITILPMLISILIYFFNNNDNRDLWDIILVIGTIYLGLLAAFQDFVRGLFYRPELDCELLLEIPHCHLLLKNKSFKNDTYYIRFKILNRGNVSANNVEVFLKSVIDSKGNYVNLSASNLLWSTLKLEEMEAGKPFSSYRMYWDYISPGTFQYCNLCDIVNPFELEKNRTDIKIEQSNNYEFNLSLYWKSINNSFTQPPGKYTFELIVAASNAKPIKLIYEIEFTGEWYDNEKDMFSKSIIIHKEKIIK